MFKEFRKTFLAAATTVILIFGGLSAYAVYENTASPEVQEVKTQNNYVGVFDSNGNLIDVKKNTSQNKASLQANESGEVTLNLTDEEFQLTQQKGMGRFKNDNGKLVEKAAPDPKYKFVAVYDQDGNVIEIKPNDGTATGNYVEIADSEYEQIQQNGIDKFKVVQGRLSEHTEQTNPDSARVVETRPDGSFKGGPAGGF